MLKLSKPILAILIILVIILVARELWAAQKVILHLKNGTKVEGELMGYDNNIFIIKVGNDIKAFPESSVSRIEFTPSKEPPPTLPPAPDKPSGPISPTRLGETRPVNIVIDKLTQRLMTYPHKELFVAWIIDDSPSLRDDMGFIEKKIDDIFTTIKFKKDILMAVVGFGAKPALHQTLTREPQLIRQAIRNVGTEGTGQENVMQALGFCLQNIQFGGWKGIFIVVTDEQGDDIPKLEATLQQLLSNKISVFVIGRETAFSWPYEFENDEQTKELVAINSGLESPDAEILQKNPICCDPKLYWQGCRKIIGSYFQYAKYFRETNPLGCELGFSEEIKSGFGSYALARLAKATDGESYFLANPAYEENNLKGYEPDLGTQDEYEKLNKENNLRRVITNIVKECTKTPNLPNRFMSRGDVKTYIKDANKLMETCGKFIKELDEALKKEPMPVATGPKSTANKRWQANGELVLGQLYALRHYLMQYILTLEEWQKPYTPPEPKPYGVKLAPVSQIKTGTNNDAKDYLMAAKEMLDLVIKNHPHTPWSQTAFQLKDNLGGFVLVPLEMLPTSGTATPGPVR